MRGKVYDSAGDVGSYGITPAYAGKSICNPLMILKMKDHPRLCGEKKR